MCFCIECVSLCITPLSPYVDSWGFCMLLNLPWHIVSSHVSSHVTGAFRCGGGAIFSASVPVLRRPSLGPCLLPFSCPRAGKTSNAPTYLLDLALGHWPSHLSPWVWYSLSVSPDGSWRNPENPGRNPRFHLVTCFLFPGGD